MTINKFINHIQEKGLAIKLPEEITEHDCHLSQDDGCKVCDEYREEKEV